MVAIGTLLLVAVVADAALLWRSQRPEPIARPFLVVRVPAWWSLVRTNGISEHLTKKGIENVIVPENREHVVAEWVTPPVNVTIRTEEVTKKEVR